MLTNILAPVPRQREFTDLGVVAPGSLLHTYVSGTPATPLATTSDAAGNVPNANPIVASPGGLFGPIYLTPGVAYRFVLTTADGLPIWDHDPVTAGAAASVLLYGNTGSNALTGNANLFSITMPALGPNDTLKLYLSLLQFVGAGVALSLLNGALLLLRLDDLGGGSLVAGANGLWEVTLRVGWTNDLIFYLAAIGGVGPAPMPTGLRANTVGTATHWQTGGWPLQLFSSGQAVGATQYWSAALYRFSG